MLPQSRIVWLLLQAGLASQTRDQPLNLSQLQDEHISTLEAAHPCRCSEITPAAPALPLASLLLHLAALSTPWGAAGTLVSTQTSFHACRKSLATESGARSGPLVMLWDKHALASGAGLQSRFRHQPAPTGPGTSPLPLWVSAFTAVP